MLKKNLFLLKVIIVPDISLKERNANIEGEMVSDIIFLDIYISLIKTFEFVFIQISF